MSRRFFGETLKFTLDAGKYHNKVVVHTRDAHEIRRFSFQAPGSSDSFLNANRANETQGAAVATDDTGGPVALYVLEGTLSDPDSVANTPDATSPVNWTTIDFIEITTTTDGRNLVLSTSDILLNSGPYRQLRFRMTYYPATSQDVPTLLVLEESETRQ